MVWRVARYADSPTTTDPTGATDCSREAVFTTSPATFSPTWGPEANVTTASPEFTAARTRMPAVGSAWFSSSTRPWIFRAARIARSASSSCATGAPNTPMTASPMNLSRVPPYRSISSLARAWNGSSVRRTSSGSAWSERSVKPARSANRIETNRRSSVGSAGGLEGDAELPGGPPTGEPQAEQNRAPWGRASPHAPQTSGRGEPHWRQNRAPVGASVPQLGQDRGTPASVFRPAWNRQVWLPGAGFDAYPARVSRPLISTARALRAGRAGAGWRSRGSYRYPATRASGPS